MTRLPTEERYSAITGKDDTRRIDPRLVEALYQADRRLANRYVDKVTLLDFEIQYRVLKVVGLHPITYAYRVYNKHRNL